MPSETSNQSGSKLFDILMVVLEKIKNVIFEGQKHAKNPTVKRVNTSHAEPKFILF